MTALSDQNGAQARLYKKAIVTHSGCCLSPRLREFLCGTPRTVLTEDAFDEDVLLSILPQRLIVTALQVCEASCIINKRIKINAKMGHTDDMAVMCTFGLSHTGLY
jgi:hypothetical protein